jgi:predicted amidophosphoribosyltransferase
MENQGQEFADVKVSPSELVFKPSGRALCRECKEKPVAEVGDVCPECDAELARERLKCPDILLAILNEIEKAGAGK